MGRALVVSFACLALWGCAAQAGRGEAPAPVSAIAWQAWSPAAFAEAKREGRLILVNVHAVWCHWCHVMDEQTFTDPEVIEAIADHYVAIRVDADARPDVAERYQRWGWPATAILTPDAQPILERRGYQAPARFRKLLRDVVADPKPRPPEASAPLPGPLTEVKARVQAQLDATYDAETEGWGQGKQKYPWSAPIEYSFLRAWLDAKDSIWRERALATLDAQRALIDPVWGGMYQYSDDGTWTSPHYEKIVSVQAGALEAYSQAYLLTGQAKWLEAAGAIYRYLVEHLRSPEGTFHASQDAEPPPKAKAAGLDGDAYFALGDAGRRQYGVPRIDTNVYANVNGTIVAALCRYYQATGDEAVLRQALAGAKRVLTDNNGEPPFLHDGSKPYVFVGDVGFPGYLSDQIAMCRAFLSLYSVTGANSWCDEATRAADTMTVFFLELRRGKGVGNPFVLSAVTARFLIQLAAVTGEDRYRTLAECALRALADAERIERQGRIVGEYLLALTELESPPPTLTVVGDLADPATEALRRAALRAPIPNALVTMSPPGESFPDTGRPALYVCGATSCSPPIHDPAQVAAQARAFLQEP